MGSDAIANSRLSAFAKESARKKGSRLAKLKQDKVDLRREHGVSRAKNKGYKIGTKGFSGALPLSIPKGIQEPKPQGNLPMRARRDEHDILGTFDTDAVPWMSSTMCPNFVRTSLVKDSSRSRSSCSGSCSSSCSEGERDEGCLDDWEAMADALTAESTKATSDVKQHSKAEQFVVYERSKSCNKTYQAATLNREAVGRAHWSQRNGRAWSPDDLSRPGSLPSLSKKTSERSFSQRHTILAWQRVVPQEKQQPSSCPICCEDLDVTDSSFLPCPCGFQLCLFCHKRILEVDARCPGCRKQYVF